MLSDEHTFNVRITCPVNTPGKRARQRREKNHAQVRAFGRGDDGICSGVHSGASRHGPWAAEEWKPVLPAVGRMVQGHGRLLGSVPAGSECDGHTPDADHAPPRCPVTSEIKQVRRPASPGQAAHATDRFVGGISPGNARSLLGLASMRGALFPRQPSLAVDFRFPDLPCEARVGLWSCRTAAKHS